MPVRQLNQQETLDLLTTNLTQLKNNLQPHANQQTLELDFINLLTNYKNWLEVAQTKHKIDLPANHPLHNLSIDNLHAYIDQIVTGKDHYLHAQEAIIVCETFPGIKKQDDKLKLSQYALSHALVRLCYYIAQMLYELNQQNLKDPAQQKKSLLFLQCFKFTPSIHQRTKKLLDKTNEALQELTQYQAEYMDTNPLVSPTLNLRA